MTPTMQTVPLEQLGRLGYILSLALACNRRVKLFSGVDSNLAVILWLCNILSMI